MFWTAYGLSARRSSFYLLLRDGTFTQDSASLQHMNYLQATSTHTNANVREGAFSEAFQISQDYLSS